MKILINILFIVLISFISISCARNVPIYNVESSPVSVDLTEEGVGKSIISAGIILGWQMRKIQPGQISAKIFLRKHMAEAEINYDAKNYSIIYKDSEELNFADGKIHKNYNSWVKNLDREIQKQLLLRSNQ